MSKTFQRKTVSVESIALFGLFSMDKGDYIDVWIIKITFKKINLKWMFASFKSRLHAKTMFVPKVPLFQLVYWFVNLILADKHGAKNLKGLIHP